MDKRRWSKRNLAGRRGVIAVEMALVLPLLMLIVIGLCVAQLGAFRYHQIAALAHEGARWASVHGKEYALQNNQPIASREAVLENAIRPRAAGIDLKKLDLEVQWDANGSLVSVTVRYRWTPEAFFAPQTLSCTALALVTY